MTHCQHDWSRDQAGAWWTCTRCPKQMHPSWTPDSRAKFEMACELLLLEMTKPDEVIKRFDV